MAGSAYYAPAVKWAVENGITMGTTASTFSPDKTVTRAQAVTFLWRAMGCPDPKSELNPFTDVSPSAYYYTAVLWATGRGITIGTTTSTFSPNDPVTRGQMITFLYRTMGSPGNMNQRPWNVDAESWAGRENLLEGTAEAYTTNGPCPRCDVVFYIWKVLAS